MIIKRWGWTRSTFFSLPLAVFDCYASHGGFCSLHKHERKRNAFLVESGHLIVVTFNDGVTAHHLTAGDVVDIAPDIYHYFHAMSDTIFKEIYTGIVNDEDIIRLSEGGSDAFNIQALLEQKRTIYGKFLN
jgi:mannose-6-phosphate isomerase-like protein (cupin superfamily)